MRCKRCKDAKALKHSDLCGICEIITAPKEERVGAQTDELVPKHFNIGLGVEIEGYDHLKKVRRKMKAEGIIDSWD